MNLDALDQETVVYVLEVRSLFEDIRTVAAQLAGVLVLATVTRKPVLPDDPMLASAAQLFDSALDGLRRTRPSRRCETHHRHLLTAAAEIGAALKIARANLDAAETDRVLGPLRAGYRELGEVARCLPGFQLVDFDRGCCRSAESLGKE